ncbi:MAG TPA: hypothetical protein VMF62_11915 [Acetobacteraceae bacterium]|jgi:hypothetical protein|nr:hypothetical protein [Acetobacteraceae bacterium]
MKHRRMKARAAVCALALLLALLLAGGRVAVAGAASPATAALDPDWPCEQIKIDHMSLATMWGGPPLGKFLADWQKYPAAAALAQHLAERRVPVAEAEAEIEAFAKAEGTERETELLAFMGGLFSLLDQERFAVVEGLDRFGARQMSYAAQIRAEIIALQDAQDAAKPDQKKIAALSQQVYWDTRVFADRRSMMSYACFVPDEIEHRMFVLAGTTANLLP